MIESCLASCSDAGVVSEGLSSEACSVEAGSVFFSASPCVSASGFASAVPSYAFAEVTSGVAAGCSSSSRRRLDFSPSTSSLRTWPTDMKTGPPCVSLGVGHPDVLMY